MKTLITRIAMLALTCCIVVGLTSCDSDEPIPEHSTTEWPYHQGDSLVMTKLFETYKKCIDTNKISVYQNPNGEIIWKSANGDEAVMLTTWTYDGATHTQRLQELYMMFAYEQADSASFIIPDYIGDLERLEHLYVEGRIFGGKLPESICGIKDLYSLYITSTSLTELPDDIFSINTRTAVISGNCNLTKVPKSIDKLVTYVQPFEPGHKWYKRDNGFFKLTANSFTDTVPTNPHAALWLENNKFTAVDWSKIGRKTWSFDEEKNQMIGYSFFKNNNVDQMIPDSLLNNNYFLMTLQELGMPQEDKLGFPNYPRDLLQEPSWQWDRYF